MTLPFSLVQADIVVIVGAVVFFLLRLFFKQE
jgi:hypothetical protein